MNVAPPRTATPASGRDPRTAGRRGGDQRGGEDERGDGAAEQQPGDERRQDVVARVRAERS